MNYPQKLREEVESRMDNSFEWEELDEGLNTIYGLRSDEGNYILKVQTMEDNENLPYYKQDRSGRFRAESVLYNIVNRETSVPSPDIVYEDFSGETYSKPFYLMEEIKGDNAADRRDEIGLDELGQIVYQYGKILGEIHKETDLGLYGLLSHKKGELTTQEGSEIWSGCFRELIKGTERVIEETWDEKPELYLQGILENIEYLPENPQSSLLHMDNRLVNLILEEDGANIIGFLDWNFARAGHNELDLIRTEYLLIDYELELELGLRKDEKEIIRDKLFKGYQETHEVEMDEEFEVRREIYRYSTVLWLLAGFPNWSSSWNEDARQEMEENLLQRLENEKLS